MIPKRAGWTMGGVKRTTVIIAWLVTASVPARAEERAPRPWTGLGRNAADSFLGWNSLFHLGAFGVTAVLSPAGVDYEVHRYFFQHDGHSAAGIPGAVLGAVGPLVTIGGLWLAGRRCDDEETLGAAWAVLQASALTLGTVTVLKLVTGRPPPQEDLVPSVAEDVPALSRTFRFGFNRGGIFWGWPSGHTAATMAVASTLAHYYPDSLTLKIVGYGAVVYMAYAVSVTDGGQMHWFSDAAAAALIAYPIGATVGSDFRRRLDGEPAAPPAAWRIVPTVGPGYVGAGAAGRF